MLFFFGHLVSPKVIQASSLGCIRLGRRCCSIPPVLTLQQSGCPYSSKRRVGHDMGRRYRLLSFILQFNLRAGDWAVSDHVYPIEIGPVYAILAAAAGAGSNFNTHHYTFYSIV